ncbi:phosphatidate cytidylyltransferase [Janthinobacterium fluminis]|uniref:Phosphatidate cytidylyltransferase n=1 Tax=Janthinobacterium fluminis TaxID=2987524 RepID=A0ABT5K4N5_9BURK|nr:phosphatidate cytidylyltransferase [Janthinobacterium fluminis]MDC8759947.1 phosphatidate cytidylyltransferase [Janthinobacterium fluminis]
MLKTRMITAVVLLAVLLPVLFFKHFPAFAAVATAFFAAAIWESLRLFKNPRALPIAAVCAAAFVYVFLSGAVDPQPRFWFTLGVAIWALRFAPALGTGLPPPAGLGNTLLSMVYAVAIVACFAAIVALFRHSPAYLLSVMALVWIADIGAYFSGKAFGKRKLAPSISPGKSWEGAFGGGVAVLALAALSVALAPSVPALADTFAVRLQGALGWAAALAILVLVAAASVVGDLFESMLKRRAGIKDSSNLLPGHGGVLDRIDALLPVLPLAALIGTWL